MSVSKPNPNIWTLWLPFSGKGFHKNGSSCLFIPKYSSQNIQVHPFGRRWPVHRGGWVAFALQSDLRGWSGTTWSSCNSPLHQCTSCRTPLEAARYLGLKSVPYQCRKIMVNRISHKSITKKKDPLAFSSKKKTKHRGGWYITNWSNYWVFHQLYFLISKYFSFEFFRIPMNVIP